MHFASRAVTSATNGAGRRTICKGTLQVLQQRKPQGSSACQSTATAARRWHFSVITPTNKYAPAVIKKLNLVRDIARVLLHPGRKESAFLFARASTIVWYLPFEDRPTTKDTRALCTEPPFRCYQYAMLQDDDGKKPM